MTIPSSTTGSLDVGATRLHYEVAGSGHPLVLLHAGIADRRMWDDQFVALAEHYRVVRYDMRGYGQSPAAAGEFSHRADLAALLDHLQIERAHLIGCSKGGMVALDFALEHPERVSALVLVASAPSGYEFGGDPPPQWDEMVDAFRQGDFARAAELEVQIWVDGPRRAPGQVDAAVRERVRAMDEIALRNEASGLGSEQPLERPAIHRLAEIAVPTLVISGDLDDQNIFAAGELAAERIPQTRRVVLAGTAHLPNMEQPAQFNRLVLDFLAEVDARWG